MKYDDIINLEYKKSNKRSRMSMADRAAQFSPFAALSGYDEAIDETARLTDSKIIIDEESLYLLDNKLKKIMNEDKRVKITYFSKDERKSGGKYLEYSGSILKYDEYNRRLIMKDKYQIYIDDIYEIEEL